ATMWRGSLTFETPMLWALGFIFVFTIGGFSGLILAVAPIDIQLQDTYYVVGHFHYVLVAGSLFGLFGGFYYWAPKWSGVIVPGLAAASTRDAVQPDAPAGTSPSRNCRSTASWPQSSRNIACSDSEGVSSASPGSDNPTKPPPAGSRCTRTSVTWNTSPSSRS